MNLTVTEAMAIQGLMFMESELTKKKAAFAAELEAAHGLDAGALGKTHNVDAAAGVIVEMKDNPENGRG